MGGPIRSQAEARRSRLDLDIKIGVVAGFNGEALRGLDLKLVAPRRAGRGVRPERQDRRRHAAARRYARTRSPAASQVLYFETNDAGALFRFTDTYPRMIGGQMWVAMDPPSGDQAPQEGLLNVRDFSCAASRRSSASPPARRAARTPASSSRACGSSSRRAPGRLTIRDGVVRGPFIGATIDGDDRLCGQRGAHARHLRAALRAQQCVRPDSDRRPVPRRRQQRRAGRHHLRGRRHARALRCCAVNPISAIAPGVLRKFFEFPRAASRPTAPRPPSRTPRAIGNAATFLIIGTDFQPSCAGSTRASRLGTHSANLSEIAGTSPAMTNGKVAILTPASATRASCGRARA